MRQTFFAGAIVLFESLKTTLAEGLTPAEADRIVVELDEEMRRFVERLGRETLA
jgi:hypothetical protein